MAELSAQSTGSLSCGQLKVSEEDEEAEAEEDQTEEDFVTLRRQSGDGEDSEVGVKALGEGLGCVPCEESARGELEHGVSVARTSSNESTSMSMWCSMVCVCGKGVLLAGPRGGGGEGGKCSRGTGQEVGGARRRGWSAEGMAYESRG